MNGKRKFRFALMLLLITIPFSLYAGSKGYVGIYPEELSEAVRAALDFEEAGVMVKEVVDESPAMKAGLLAGDIIMKVGDKKMFTTDRLFKSVGKASPGSQLDLTIWRKGKKKSITVTVGERPENPGNMFLNDDSGMWFDNQDHKFMIHKDDDEHSQRMINIDRDIDEDEMVITVEVDDEPDPWLGISMQRLTPQLARYFGADEDSEVLISEVLDDSPAQKAGLVAGDVLVKLAGERIEEMGDVREALSEKEPGDRVDVQVLRDGKKQKFSAVLAERTTEEETIHLDDLDLEGLKELKGLEDVPGKIIIKKVHVESD